MENTILVVGKNFSVPWLEAQVEARGARNYVCVDDLAAARLAIAQGLGCRRALVDRALASWAELGDLPEHVDAEFLSRG